jgi:hypothetical protein
MLLAGCTAQPALQASDPGLADLTITAVHPSLLLPGTAIAVAGKGFVDASRGDTRLRLRGRFGDQDIDVTIPAQRAADGLLTAPDDGFFRTFGAGHFSGRASVVVNSPLDGRAHASGEIDVELELADTLQPTLTSAASGNHAVNDAILLEGDGFLLGDGEGATHVVVEGCFQAAGTAGACAQVGVDIDMDLVARPATPWERRRAVFLWSPEIAGIGPGAFLGTVRVVNVSASGSLSAGPVPLSLTVSGPRIDAISPASASLGQIVRIEGAGFVGAADDEITLLHLRGEFQADGAPAAVPVELRLVPRFVDGGHLAYILDEEDALGQVIDLRRTTGQFSGEVSPIVRKGAVELAGDPLLIRLAVAPLKQVVHVRFLPSYVDSLRLYGLAFADAAVRARVLELAARDYQGVNVEFRESRPDDFVLYAEVEIAGPDPNALGLFGYDNTPGKDVGNQRLWDRIGGVNATTQADGFPGFGGVFADQFLGFSQHPVSAVEPQPVASPLFDRIFDPLRADRGGTPIREVEAQLLVPLRDGTSCPAADRPGQLACAVFVLGNLLGNTLTHEFGHSLGLADPTRQLCPPPMDECFHDLGDAADRLMDAGDGRPFEERAELEGQGPAVFCDAEYAYMRAILPGLPANQVARPGCGSPE